MSFFQSTLALFYGFSLISCVLSHTFSLPTEVTAVTEVVKENDFYHSIMTALLQRLSIDDVDEGEENDRVKKSPAAHAKAAQMPATKLLNLLLLTFRHLFSFSSKKKIDGETPITPSDSANTLLKILGTRLARLKEKPRT